MADKDFKSEAMKVAFEQIEPTELDRRFTEFSLAVGRLMRAMYGIPESIVRDSRHQRGGGRQ